MDVISHVQQTLCIYKILCNKNESLKGPTKIQVLMTLTVSENSEWNIEWNIYDAVIKWKHFQRYWPLCVGNSPVTGEFPSQRPVTRSFDVFSDVHLNKMLSQQLRHWWFEMPSCSLWRHCNGSTLTEKLFWPFINSLLIILKFTWGFMTEES